MGSTMSELADRDHHRFHFNSLITLGSPIFHNQAPHETRVINYVSDGDHLASDFTRFGPLFGYKRPTGFTQRG